MAKTRITSVLLPTGWSTVSGCTVEDGLWTCRAWGQEHLVIKEEHVYAWRHTTIQDTPEANGLGVFE
tara:strand:- start:330 stop:530 length:201 start_codon:yes stop_codon:yes gene_type:complete